MAKYTEGFKQKVKDDYIKGKFATITDLAKAHKITNTQLISRWKRVGEWDEETKQREEERKQKELVSQNEGRELEQYRELSAVHNNLWKAVIAQLATRFKKRDDGTVPQLNEAQLESLSRILLRAQEGQRKALGIDDGTAGDQNITINYPGLSAICKNPQLYENQQNGILDVGVVPVTPPEETGQ